MNIPEKLLKIQSELKAPKNQYNSFGKYHYRSCEDILEGLKPLLDKYKATLTIADEIVQIGERYYVKSVATLQDTESKEFVHSIAYAREDEFKKGMDSAQVTGSTSSYARKYALNGLFAIDDTKDSDSINQNGKEQGQAPVNKSQGPDVRVINNASSTNGKALSDKQITRLYAIAKTVGIDKEKADGQVKAKFNKEVAQLTKEEYDAVCKGYESMKK